MAVPSKGSFATGYCDLLTQCVNTGEPRCKNNPLCEVYH